jgi:hypothetical protein
MARPQNMVSMYKAAIVREENIQVSDKMKKSTTYAENRDCFPDQCIISGGA